jgi:large subunit ribosomal protein L18
MYNRKVKQRQARRTKRVRSRLNTTTTPLIRISVFRSLKNIYVQAIDDTQHKTLAAASSLDVKSVKGDKKEIAKAVGLALAQKAKIAGVQKACFDRGSFLYHGRVKALAEGIREGGIQI